MTDAPHRVPVRGAVTGRVELAGASRTARRSGGYRKREQRVADDARNRALGMHVVQATGI